VLGIIVLQNAQQGAGNVSGKTTQGEKKNTLNLMYSGLDRTVPH